MGNRTLFLFPDAQRMEQALVEASSGDQDFVDASCYLSWQKWVQLFEPERLLHRRLCPPLAGRLLLFSAAQSIEDNPFGDFIVDPAFSRTALELLLALKAGDCSVEAFEKATGKFPPSRQAVAVFLGRLYRAYEQGLREKGLADREDLLGACIERVDQGPLPTLLQKVDVVEIHDLYDVSPRRLRFLTALARRLGRENKELSWNFPASGNEFLDAVLDSVLKKVEVGWADFNARASKAYVDTGTKTAALARQLFRDDASDELHDAPVQWVSAASPREEAREIALGVHRWLKSGVPPEQVAVAFRELGRDAERVAEALAEVGVQARYRVGAPLTSTNVGKLAIDLPNLVDEHFPVEALTRCLESRYFRKVQGGPSRSVSSLLKQAGIRDNRLGASASEGAYALRLREYVDRIHNKNPAHAGRIKEVSGRILRFLELAGRLPEQAGFSEHLQAWWQTLEALGLPDAVEEEARQEEGTPLGEAVLRAMAHDRAAVTALQEWVTDFHEALRHGAAGHKPLSRRMFHRWLHDAASDVNVPPQGPRENAVRLMDLRELVGARFTHVWLGGAVDGRFPGRALGAFLLSEEDMRAINQAVGHEVFQLYAGDLDRRIPYRPAEDRLLLFHALHAASGEVCVSYARRGLSGKEQLPSPFLTELARLSQKSIRHVPTSSVPNWEQVATEAMLRQRVALETLARSEFRQDPRLPGHAALKAHFEMEPWFAEAAVMKKMDDERLVFFSHADVPAGVFSGRISSPPTLEFLNARLRFDAERPLSASQLGQLAGCAYKGFLSYVLGLREEEEPTEELDARGLGSFWHQVLEKLMPRLQEARLLKAPWEQIPQKLIDEVIDEAAREYEANEHTGHPLLWQLVKPRTRKMLRTLLRQEHAGLPFEGAEPSATELSFGKKTSEPKWQDICLPAAFPGETPVYFTGTIDRLDEGRQQTGVLDYKLKNLKKSDLRKELLTDSFQIPLYLMAVREKTSAQKVEGGWLSLKSGEFFKLSELLRKEELSIEALLATDEKSRAEARESGKLNFANAVHDVLGRLRQGDVSPRPTRCDYCPYQAACRISERRVTEGDGDE